MTPAPQVAGDLRVRAKWDRAVAGEMFLLGCSVLSLILSCLVWSSRKQAWMDEIFTWKEASDPSLFHLLHAIQQGADGGQPLFYTTVWLWEKVFGNGVLTLRLYSCVAVCGALLVVWKTLRSYYGMWATAFGVLAIWGTSSVLLDQNAEARFYGLYLLTAAIAVNLYARLIAEDNVSYKLLLLTLLAQTALVLTHVLGLIYSGLILMALIVSDACRRRFRLKIYLFHIAGWLALLVWLPAIRASMAAGRPRGWIAMPAFQSVLDSYTFEVFFEWIVFIQQHTRDAGFAALRHLSQFFIAVPLIVVLFVVLKRFVWGRERHSSDGEGSLLLLAFSLLLAPLILFVLSHLVAPVFTLRYVLPSAIGVAVIFAAFAHICGADREPSGVRSSGARSLRLLWPMLSAVFLICPIASALIAQTPFSITTTLDVRHLENRIPPGADVVVGWQQDFSRLMRYGRPQVHYYFLLDWPAALAGAQGSVLDYHLMTAYRAAGYYASAIQDQDAFLCAHADFFELDARESSWAKVLMPELPELEWKVVDSFNAPEVRRVLYVVHRKSPLPFCNQR